MGETLSQMKNQLNEFWNELEKPKRIKIGISCLFIIAAVTALIFFGTRTKYVVLYDNLSLKDTSLITKKLDDMGVKWKNDGNKENVIMVPSDIKNRAKIELASEGLPKEGYGFLDAFNDSSWTMTDYDKRQRLKIALQNELASTISEIEGIENAKVYIKDSFEDSSFVINDNSQMSASVFINKVRGSNLPSAKIIAIRNLVASSVGMSPDMVSIIDDAGKLLTENTDSSSYDMTDQLSIQNEIQIRINESIRRFLENIFGYGNVDVRTNANVNFDSEITSIVEFKPSIEGSEEGLVRSMERVEEHVVNMADGGIPGTETNSEDITDYGQIENENSKYDKASETINFELDEINKQIKKAPGQIESITVAVLINQKVLKDGELTEEKQKEISDLIYAATGLSTKQVKVISEDFNKEALNSSLDIPLADTKVVNPLLYLLFAIIGAATIIGITVYIKKKNKYDINELIEEKSGQNGNIEEIDFETEKSQVKAQINNFVDKKPDSVAQLLRTWLNEE